MTPQPHFDAELRKFLCMGSGWTAIPVKEKGKPAPEKEDLPFITLLRVNTRHISIPYYIQNGEAYHDVEAHRVYGVDVVSRYSAQFHGDENTEGSAMDMALAMSLWVYSPAGQHAASGLPFWFSILDCSEVQEVNSLVNGMWEDRARLNMLVKHFLVLTQVMGLPIQEVPIQIEGIPEIIVRYEP